MAEESETRETSWRRWYRDVTRGRFLVEEHEEEHVGILQ